MAHSVKEKVGKLYNKRCTNLEREKVAQHKLGERVAQHKYFGDKVAHAVQYWRCGDERSRLSHLRSLTIVKLVALCSGAVSLQAGVAALSLSPSSPTGQCVVCAMVWSSLWCGVAHCGLTV